MDCLKRGGLMPDLIDQLYARGLGVDLTDSERIRALVVVLGGLAALWLWVRNG